MTEEKQKDIEGSLKIESGPIIQTTFGEGFRLRLSLFPQHGPISIQRGSNKTQNTQAAFKIISSNFVPPCIDNVGRPRL